MARSMMENGASWGEFESGAPELAAAGRRLLAVAQDHVAFLATTRGDGSPQLHPVVPYVVAGGLYVFVVNLSSKHDDLIRDGRYALHMLPGPENSEEFLVRGAAQPVSDAATVALVQRETGAGGHGFEVLFEFKIATCLHTLWSGWGTPAISPQFTRWKPAAP